MHGFVRWWDSVEQWLTGLPFLAQVLLAVLTMVPLAVVLAVALNTVVGLVFAGWDRLRGHAGTAESSDAELPGHAAVDAPTVPGDPPEVTR